MCRDGDIGRIADDFVLNAPFAVFIVALGEVEGTGDNADRRIALRQPATEILEMGPVVPVKALPDLRTHIREEEGVVHGFLAPFGVCGRDLVATIVTGAEIVLELATEFFGHGNVFNEVAVFAVPVRDGQGRRRDVFRDPDGVPKSAVVGGDK